MESTPTTGYYVEIDLAGGVEDVQKLRDELRGTGIAVSVIEMSGPSGNPFIRLRTNGRTKLQEWLDNNGYDREVDRIVDARNPNAVPHQKVSHGEG